MTNTTISQLPSGSPVQSGDLAAISRSDGFGAYNSYRIALGTISSQDLPSYTGLSGYFLSNNGSVLEWSPPSSAVIFTFFIREVTAPGDITVTNGDSLIAVENNSSSPTNVFLPMASVASGKSFVIKDALGFAGANNVTIIPSGADLIDGGATLVLNIGYQAFTLAPKTGGWMVVA